MSTQTITQRGTQSTTTKALGNTDYTPTLDGNNKAVSRVPTAVPPFTVGDLRRAIPAHCFTRPLTKSFGYLFWDLFLVGVIYYASTFIPVVASDERFGATFAPLLRHVLWTAYWICQGCVMTGLWVIGHECGHGGFADSQLINDVVGWVVHSALLVPYFSWQISHRRHHSNTGSIERDEVFVPRKASPAEIKARQEKLARGKHEHEVEEGGFVQQWMDLFRRLGQIVFMLTLGWPAYLIANTSGNASYDPKAWVNHFFPSSPIYTHGLPTDSYNQMLVVLSDIGMVGMIGVLYYVSQLYTFATVFYVYIVPYLITNLFLVLITFMQHTDLSLPHYDGTEWDWLRGALATVDRDYGILNKVFHNITDTHVVHHIFSAMPHYHAEEATEALKPLLGKYYLYDKTPITKALWDAWRDCGAVYPDGKQGGVFWF